MLGVQALTVAGLCVLAGTADSATGAGIRLDPERVGWSEIRMTASKLFLSADARLVLREVPAAGIAGSLDAFPGTAIQPGPRVVELVYEADGAGRRSTITLWMDPVTGAALQRTQQDFDKDPRRRVYRFGETGAYHRTRWPATEVERNLPPDQWTRRSEGLRAYPDEPEASVVVEPTGLLYAVGAAPLEKPGDVVELVVFRRRDLQTVRIEVLPPKEVELSYDELTTDGKIRRSGRVQPLRVALTGLPVPGQKAGEEFELLGLRGRLELLLDPETRAPVQLSGRVKILGQVTLRLVAMRPR